jgi:hypothetical protein
LRLDQPSSATADESYQHVIGRLHLTGRTVVHPQRIYAVLAQGFEPNQRIASERFLYPLIAVFAQIDKIDVFAALKRAVCRIKVRRRT